jgi:S1-C subfamily serine protease
LLALILYGVLFPVNQLTESEVNDVVASAMASATPRPPDAVLVYQAVQPSIVYIEAKFVDEDGKDSGGLGTGMIINDFGDIVTSLHVVEDARISASRLPTGRSRRRHPPVRRPSRIWRFCVHSIPGVVRASVIG